MSWLRFSFDSCLDQIFLVSLVINGLCQHLGLDEVTTAEVEVSAVEGVTNVIRHAYHQRAGNQVDVLIRFDQERLELEITDRGDSMSSECVDRLRNGSNVLEFDLSNVQALPEGGMGLQIIHQAMDMTAYTSEGGINCLRLTKRLTRKVMS